MTSFFTVPKPIAAFNAHFPLRSYPAIERPDRTRVSAPTLWIEPPPSTSQPADNLLSADVECLKWQAYLALRGLKQIKLRWDIAPEGAVDGALPNLHLPSSSVDGELLAAQSIPGWVDSRLGVDSGTDGLEGYKDDAARVESRAWVSLLEGVVHAALLISKPAPSYLHSLLFPSSTSDSLQKILAVPPAPLTGLLSVLPPTAIRINTQGILSQYTDAIASLSERLGTDNWFLGSSEPTPLDALVFAYLHCILDIVDPAVRIQVTRRVNLVAWEWKVRCLVREGFKQ